MGVEIKRRCPCGAKIDKLKSSVAQDPLQRLKANYDEIYYAVICTACGAQGPGCLAEWPHEGRPRAIELWNSWKVGTRKGTALWLEQQGEGPIFDALSAIGWLPADARGLTAAELVEYAKSKGLVRLCCEHLELA